MANLLFLAPQLPYPPSRGSRTRAYHLLEHLAAKHRVFLATLIDDPEDEQYVDVVRAMCADLQLARVSKEAGRAREVRALLRNEPVSVARCRDAGLRDWIDAVVRGVKIDAAIAASPAMAAYLEHEPRLTLLVDFGNVDSARWVPDTSRRHGVRAWLRRREAECLLTFDRELASRAARSFFVTESGRMLFRKLAPECALRTETMPSGVDARHFAPDPASLSPFRASERAIVFAGEMDHSANEEAALWFISDVLPRICETRPDARFYVVGRRPSAELKSAAGPQVMITGTVPDVRPYLQHAAVIVVPARAHCGLHQSVLEGMAMARPVIAAADCATAIDANPGQHLLIAGRADEFAERAVKLLNIPELAAAIGRAARQHAIERYTWDRHLASLDRYFEPGRAEPGKAEAGAGDVQRSRGGA